jgi:hypothetical protein
MGDVLLLAAAALVWALTPWIAERWGDPPPRW